MTIRKRFSRQGRVGVALATLSAVSMTGLAVPGHAQPNDGVGQASRVALLTGAGSINATDVYYQVLATDLGIMWTDERGQIMTAFGDTFGHGWTGSGAGTGDPALADWRSNTLARSTDTDPSDGLTFDNFVTDRPGHAKELIPSLKRDQEEISTIPTGGINIDGRDYLAYMSVRNFGLPGRWTTNYGGIAYSDDNGETWIRADSSLRLNSAAFDNRFQMISFAAQGDTVYVFGTPNGRFGDAYLARVAKGQILDLGAYEYWTGNGWARGAEDRAASILPAPVGEISVRYDPDLGGWLMMYLDESRQSIVLRAALRPEGPWSSPVPVANATRYPSLYGGFLHPNSSKRELYFTMTQYEHYNVSLMKIELPRNILHSVVETVLALAPGR